MPYVIALVAVLSATWLALSMYRGNEPPDGTERHAAPV